MKYVFSQECLLRFATGELRFIGHPDDPRIAAASRASEASKAGHLAMAEDIALLENLPVIDAPKDYDAAQEAKQTVTLL